MHGSAGKARKTILAVFWACRCQGRVAHWGRANAGNDKMSHKTYIKQLSRHKAAEGADCWSKHLGGQIPDFIAKGEGGTRSQAQIFHS